MINDWILLSIFSVFSVIILCELWFCHNVIFRKTVKMTAITAFTNAINLMNKRNIASWQRLKNRIQYDGSDSAEIPCYKPTWSDGTSKSIEEMKFMIERETPPKKTDSSENKGLQKFSCFTFVKSNARTSRIWGQGARGKVSRQAKISRDQKH